MALNLSLNLKSLFTYNFDQKNNVTCLTRNFQLLKNIDVYVILNDGRPKDLNKAIELSEKAGKIFEKNAKKHGMTGWGVATTIAPQDMHNPSNIFFWDIYDSMSGVMKHMAYESVISEVPQEMNMEFSENMPNGFNHRNICEILSITKPKM